MAGEHGYGLRIEQLAEHASELAKSQVDVIVCAGVEPVRAAQQATKSIPIVGNADDLVASGLVRSLANPEGNTTGFSILATELDGKRQEILMLRRPSGRPIKASISTGPPRIGCPEPPCVTYVTSYRSSIC